MYVEVLLYNLGEISMLEFRFALSHGMILNTVTWVEDHNGLVEDIKLTPNQWI